MGKWTATEVLETYIAQAVVASEATNCATEGKRVPMISWTSANIFLVLFEQALQRARQLDEEYASTKELRGPLHGVPFSAKVVSSRAPSRDVFLTIYPSRINGIVGGTLYFVDSEAL